MQALVAEGLDGLEAIGSAPLSRTFLGCPLAALGFWGFGWPRTGCRQGVRGRRSAGYLHLQVVRPHVRLLPLAAGPASRLRKSRGILSRAVEKGLLTRDTGMLYLERLRAYGRFTDEIIEEVSRQIGGS